MVAKHSVNKVLGKVVVRAEPVPSEGGFNDNDEHPWMSELRDLMFSAEPVGSGVEVIVDRFLWYEEEEQTRDVMGLSALRRAQELARLVQQGEAQRNGMGDADLATHLLATKALLKATWNKDACQSLSAHSTALS